MKGTCYYAHGGGGRVKFLGAKNCSADGKEMNTLVASAMAKATEMNKKSKIEDKYDLYNYPEHLNFKHLKIGVDYNYE